MTFADMDEAVRQFLKTLFEQTGGQSSRQVSMYDVGAALGWDRDAASRAAQDLMACGFVEIRTLSGVSGSAPMGRPWCSRRSAPATGTRTWPGSEAAAS